MKIIVSHDVDHLYWSEHIFKDLYITKLWLRSFKLMLTGVISPSTFISRINFWTDKRINRLEELMAYEKALNIPATYFFVMRPGLGVAYTAAKAAPVMNRVRENGFSVGVHGMAYDDITLMQEEYKRFSEYTGLKKFGVRMHYLRNDEKTIQRLAETGYWYDSTAYDPAKPYKVQGMTEFPIAVMDAYAVRPEHKNELKSKAYTLDRLEQAEKNGVQYFTINFHDLVFHEGYSLYKGWFTWLIETCKERGYEFVNFEQAINEL